MGKSIYGLLLLTGTFGIGSGAAGVIYVALTKMFNSGTISFARLAALTATTGVGAIVLIGILGFGGAFIAKKLKAGKAATVAW